MNSKTKDLTNPASTLVNWLTVIIWAAVIFTLSSIPQIKISQFLFWDFVVKKTAHVTEYAIFYALIFRATRGKWALSYLLIALYALSDEFHQKFVPGRTATLLDAAFDLTGANVASYIIWKLKQIRRNKLEKSPKKSH